MGPSLFPFPQAPYVASMYWYSPGNSFGENPCLYVTHYNKQVGKEFESVEMLWSQFEGVMGSGAGGEVGTADAEKAGGAVDVMTMGEAGEAVGEVKEGEEEEGNVIGNR